jgi:hypothetical protein
MTEAEISGCQDIQHNNSQLTTIGIKGLFVTLSIMAQYIECIYAECRYAECHYAEYRIQLEMAQQTSS